MKNYKGQLGLLLTSAIWGTGFIACDILLEHMTSFQLLAFRFVIASVVLLIACAKRLKNIDRRTLLWGSLFGVLLYLGFALQVTGLMYTTPSKNAFLTTLSVIIVPFIAVVIFRRKVDKFSIAGAIIAMAGAMVLSFNMDFSVNIGDVLTVASAFFYALHIVLISEMSKKIDPALLTLLQTLTCAIIGVAIIIPLGQLNLAPINSSSLPVLIYLSIACTSLCFFLQVYFQKFTSEVTAAITLSTEGIFASVFSVALALEPMTLKLVFGSILIFSAGTISQTKLSFLRKSRRPIHYDGLDEKI